MCKCSEKHPNKTKLHSFKIYIPLLKNCLLLSSRKPTDKAARKSLGEELALDVDGVLDDLVDPVLARLVHQVPVHQAREVSVETLQSSS